MTSSSPWKFWLHSRVVYFEWQVRNVSLWCHNRRLLSVLIYYYHSVHRTSCGDHPGSNIWNSTPLLWFLRHMVCWQTVCWQIFSPIPGSVFPAYVTKYFYWYRKYQNPGKSKLLQPDQISQMSPQWQTPTFTKSVNKNSDLSFAGTVFKCVSLNEYGSISNEFPLVKSLLKGVFRMGDNPPPEPMTTTRTDVHRGAVS